MKQYRPGPYYVSFWQGMKDCFERPFKTRKHSYGTVVVDASGKGVFSLTLRGNSKQRRQQVRYALRYMNN